jgi:hypothetical protein
MEAPSGLRRCTAAVETSQRRLRRLTYSRGFSPVLACWCGHSDGRHESTACGPDLARSLGTDDRGIAEREVVGQS